MMHFRTHAGQEVDIVLEKRDGSVFGIEIKATATPGSDDFAGLKLLRQELGPRFAGGALLHLGNQVVPAGERLWSAPISLLWTL